MRSQGCIEAPSGFALLQLLHDRVTQTRGPAGFRGTIGIAVSENSSSRAWVGRFDDSIQSGFADRVPADADCTLLLGRDASRAVLAGKPPSDSKNIV